MNKWSKQNPKKYKKKEKDEKKTNADKIKKHNKIK